MVDDQRRLRRTRVDIRRAQKVKKNSIRRPARFAAVSAATVVVGAALASAGFAGLRALDLGPAAAQQYPKKVTICHRTGSKTNPFVTITTSNNALPAHSRHQDGRDIIPAPAGGCPTASPQPAAPAPAVTPKHVERAAPAPKTRVSS
jgi:hypothetical protein